MERQKRELTEEQMKSVTGGSDAAHDQSDAARDRHLNDEASASDQRGVGDHTDTRLTDR